LDPQSEVSLQLPLPVKRCKTIENRISVTDALEWLLPHVYNTARSCMFNFDFLSHILASSPKLIEMGDDCCLVSLGSEPSTPFQTG